MAYATILLLLLFLTLPGNDYPVNPLPDNKPLLVYEDPIWPEPDISDTTSLDETEFLLSALQNKPGDDEISLLKKSFFDAAPYINQNPALLEKYIKLFAEIRNRVKNLVPSGSLPTTSSYLMIEGGRTLLEEIIINNNTTVSPELFGTSAFSAAPSGNLGGITVHSGDILLSKSMEPVSQVFSRIPDFPAVYSHIAMVYVDEHTDSVFVIEAHAVQGTIVRKADEYLDLPKKRLMVLRFHPDLPEIKKDPLLPHKAAIYALNEALNRNVPYDFKMNHLDSTLQFCAEVPYFAYKSLGLLLWDPVPQFLSAGNTKMLARFEVPSREILLLSYIEYDPRLIITAEWFFTEKLYQDHLEMVVMDAMIKRAPDIELDYPFYLLPFARIVKAYSSTAVLFGAEPVIPPGMPALVAARFFVFLGKFIDVLKLTSKKAEDYAALNNRLPGIRCLAGFAEESLKEYGE